MSTPRAACCPACNDALRATSEQLGVWTCPTCGGVWTDPAATAALRAASDAVFTSVSDRAAAQARTSLPADRPGRRCPICRNVLQPTNVAGVTIDTCAAHGTWFDRGEMATVCDELEKKATTSKINGWDVVEACALVLSLFV